MNTVNLFDIQNNRHSLSAKDLIAATQKYVFLRRNNASFAETPPTRLTEKEARTLLLVAGRKRVDADIERLKRGGSVFTRYGTYTAKAI